MQEKIPTPLDEFLALTVKVLIPAMIGVCARLAVEMERKKITLKRALISVIVGVGFAWQASPIVMVAVGVEYQPIVISVTAILAKDTVQYLIYKFNIDNFLGAILEAGKDFIINLFTGRKN